MPLPGDLTSITVTGTFLDGSGRPLGGTVMFWPSAELTDATGMVILGMTPLVATVSPSTGEFSQVVACTDNANLLPAGWTWKIQVAVGGAAQVFNTYIPHSLGSTVDISALGPVAPLPSLTGPYVVSVNGQSGQVTLNAGGIIPPAGDIGGTAGSPTVVSTHLASALPAIQGGTGNTAGTAVNISSTLDQVPAPAANVSLNSHKITSLAGGTAATDAVAFGQVMSLLATTGIGGYALVNGTGTILSWTVPNDGNLHRILVIGEVIVTSPETGGVIVLNFNSPTGGANTRTIFAGTQGAGYVAPSTGGTVFLVAGNQTVTLAQSTALSGGAATAWAELWGS